MTKEEAALTYVKTAPELRRPRYDSFIAGYDYADPIGFLVWSIENKWIITVNNIAINDRTESEVKLTELYQIFKTEQENG